MKYKYIVLLIIIYTFSRCTFTCSNYLQTYIKPQIISGVVISKTGNNCFGEIVLRNGSNVDTIKDICYCVPEKEKIWNYVVKDDSLYKPTGSLVVTVTRNRISKQFIYPCCDY